MSGGRRGEARASLPDPLRFADFATLQRFMRNCGFANVAANRKRGQYGMSDGGRADVARAGGTARPPSPPESGDARHERRVLTALCYDLVDSTRLLGLLDIEDYEELISAF